MPSLLYYCFAIPVGIFDFLQYAKQSIVRIYISIVYINYVRIRIRSEYVSHPLRRSYHCFQDHSLKPPKWVQNRQSSVRNQTSTNSDDTSCYRYRYDVVFLAVYVLHTVQCPNIYVHVYMCNLHCIHI